MKIEIKNTVSACILIFFPLLKIDDVTNKKIFIEKANACGTLDLDNGNNIIFKFSTNLIFI